MANRLTPDSGMQLYTSSIELDEDETNMNIIIVRPSLISIQEEEGWNGLGRRQSETD